MSFHSENFGLYPKEKQLKSWVGDAALLFITRLVLSEKYHFLPIKFQMQREKYIVKNSSLTKYCLRNKLNFGCNHLEILMNELILSNEIDKAKEIILDIINHDEKTIKQLDSEQILNGDIKPEFKEQFIKKQIQRKEMQEKHEKIRNLNVHYLFKEELHKELKSNVIL